MFSDEQKKLLAAPLNSANVKSRAQSGRTLSYVEGWLVIAEANRIFGFDGWTRETLDIRVVAERERKIGKEPNQKDGWGVSYVAKVRVIAFAGEGLVTREGVGAGHGIDADLGQAHESAIKEAETDAMKRALMTFGNPFGLALYDKEQANVVSEVKAAYMESFRRALADATDDVALGTWWNSDEQKTARRVAGIEPTEMHDLKARVVARVEALKKQKVAA
jgi:DNA repair and recombination protein RAD52